ncbi:flavin reductase [Streptomyces sp. NPDC088812]|uniref:flavin reductase n=1 Tax=Streptomyces sp. NPDC088812 TaxID=3365905 RepID=UPI0037F266FA
MRAAVDESTFRQTLSRWPSGVAIVTTDGALGRHGMTASSFCSLSLDPPLVLVCTDRRIRSHRLIQEHGVFAVSVLGRDHIGLGRRFAGLEPGVEDRFAGGDWRPRVTGSPVLADAAAWIDCRVRHAYPGGDHTIFVGEVVDACVPRLVPPLLFHSRSWGQVADPLPDRVTVADTGTAGRLALAGASRRASARLLEDLGDAGVRVRLSGTGPVVARTSAARTSAARTSPGRLPSRSVLVAGPAEAAAAVAAGPVTVEFTVADRPTGPGVTSTDRSTGPGVTVADRSTAAGVTSTDRPTPPGVTVADRPTGPGVTVADRSTTPGVTTTDRPTAPAATSAVPAVDGVAAADLPALVSAVAGAGTAVGRVPRALDPARTAAVLDLVAALRDAGCDEIALEEAAPDAGGAAPAPSSPLHLRTLLQDAVQVAGPVPLRLCLRDDHGLGLVNALTAMKSGIRHFDTALGGCDGTLDTERLLLLCSRMGVDTAVESAALARCRDELARLVRRGRPRRPA